MPPKSVVSINYDPPVPMKRKIESIDVRLSEKAARDLLTILECSEIDSGAAFTMFAELKAALREYDK